MNRVRLSYLCRPTNVQEKDVYDDLMDEYVDKVPLVEHAFTTDAAEVHTYIVRFTSGSTVAEKNMVAHAAESNGSLDFMALKDYYEGVGVHAVNTMQADKVLNGLFYSGEKKPHMWWEEFDRQLIDKFNTYNLL